MLKRLLITFVAIAVFSGYATAQFVIVNSPSNLEGSYTFEAAGFGADLTSGVWTEDGVFVDDGVDVGSDACEALVNGADLMGKIALIDRGGCEFGSKCLKAEQAGAIAAVVFNNAAGAGPIVMGAGAEGGSVTIPCVMLSLEDGDLIRDALMSGEVNITIGDVMFNDNISVVREAILNPYYSTMPASQFDAGPIPFTTGAVVTNDGVNEATNVTVDVSVDYQEFGGSSGINVFTSNGGVAAIESDSSELIVMEDYTASEGVGTYFVSYNIGSDATDEVPADNVVSSEYTLTENQYSKGRWDFTTNQPMATTGFTPSAGGGFEFLTGFRVPDGVGMVLDTVVVQLSLNQPTTVGDLEENSVSVLVYDWIDDNEDGTAETEEMTVVSYNSIEFADPSLEDAWLRVPLLTFPDAEPGGVVIDETDKTYFVGIRYEGSEVVFFGFDQGYDQTVATDLGFITNDVDLPYIGVNGFDGFNADMTTAFLFTGTRSALATGLIINSAPSDSKEEARIAGLEIFPNPTTDMLTLEIELEEIQSEMTYRIVDASGRLVSEVQPEINGLYDKANFDVSTLPAGQYFLIVKTDNGQFSEAFSVQR